MNVFKNLNTTFIIIIIIIIIMGLESVSASEDVIGDLKGLGVWLFFKVYFINGKF